MTTPTTIHIEAGWGLELILRPPPPVIETIVTVRYGNFTAQGRGNHMSYTLPVDHLIVVQVGYVDAHGNAAKVDGAVAWSSSNDEIARVRVDVADSTMCTVTAAAGTGIAQITATADADLGEGVRELVTLLDIEVVAGEAVAGTINVVATPQPIAVHAEPRK